MVDCVVIKIFVRNHLLQCVCVCVCVSGGMCDSVNVNECVGMCVHVHVQVCE